MDKGAEKLIYWGFSYGTVIGATFALRYPDQVERMVLDGVVDAQDYYNGGWRTSLLDADAVLDKFCEYCERAGSSRCALYDEHGVAPI
jgi:pimeloyl-ACP methyl ester carboxylesterase